MSELNITKKIRITDHQNNAWNTKKIRLFLDNGAPIDVNFQHQLQDFIEKIGKELIVSQNLRIQWNNLLKSFDYLFKSAGFDLEFHKIEGYYTDLK